MTVRTAWKLPSANPTSPAVEPTPLEPEPDSPAVEPDPLADDPAVPEEVAIEAVVVGTARRQPAAHTTGPEDDVPRRYGRTRAQTRRLE